MIVEDEEPIRQSLAKLLRRYFRNVLVSEDGQEGLKHLHEEDPVDLVLSDIRMLKLDGFAMARAIRKEWPELPIIFLSAHNDVANLLDAIEIGVEHFIVKPIESQKMIDILTRVCRRINESRELEQLRKKEQIQRAMRAFELTTTRLINAIPLPTILLDEEDRILLANPQFIKLFDLEEVGLLSERIEAGECFLPDLICQRPEHFPACRACWKEMACGLCQDDECLIALKGDDEINYQLRLGELVDEEGNMRYLSCFIPS